MNKKRWVVASLAVFVFVMAIEALYSNYCLKGVYAEHANLWRPMGDMMARMPYYWVSAFIVSFIFTYIYIKGYEGKSSRMGEGFRFGLLFGLFVNLTMSTITYATMPISVKLAVYWFLTGMVEYILAGIIVGLIYKKA
jgi:hypothetical protein